MCIILLVMARENIFGAWVMKPGTLFAVLLLAALPLSGGTLFTGMIDPSQAIPTTAGTYGPGLTLSVSVTGTVNLDAPSGLIITNPDGSLASIPSASCTSCWAPGYQYFIPGSNTYPTVAGGDGTNHFAGGGGNYDMFPGMGSPWAAEGKQTTDTTDPGALRFGALAYTFVANPTNTDWNLLAPALGGGLYGNTISTGNGGTLQLIVIDTYYPNNSGGFSVTVFTPEPSAAWLSFSGVAFWALARRARRPRARS